MPGPSPGTRRARRDGGARRRRAPVRQRSPGCSSSVSVLVHGSCCYLLTEVLPRCDRGPGTRRRWRRIGNCALRKKRARPFSGPDGGAETAPGDSRYRPGRAAMGNDLDDASRSRWSSDVAARPRRGVDWRLEAGWQAGARRPWRGAGRPGSRRCRSARGPRWEKRPRPGDQRGPCPACGELIDPVIAAGGRRGQRIPRRPRGRRLPRDHAGNVDVDPVELPVVDA